MQKVRGTVCVCAVGTRSGVFRAVFSDWLHQIISNNNYQSNYSFFEAHGSILGQVTMQEVRGTVGVCSWN